MAPGAEVIVSQYCFRRLSDRRRTCSAEPGHRAGQGIRPRSAARCSGPSRPRPRHLRRQSRTIPPARWRPTRSSADFIRAGPAACAAGDGRGLHSNFWKSRWICLPLVRAGTKPNLLLMRTFSKIYGLAGLRIGYGIGTPELIAALEKVRQPFNINSIAQAGALAALDDAEHVAATRANNAAGCGSLRTLSRRWGLNTFLPPRISFWCASATGQDVFNACRSRASSSGRWAAINCPNGFASRSARRRRTHAAWRRCERCWPDQTVAPSHGRCKH